jgi:hypothetical protein
MPLTHDMIDQRSLAFDRVIANRLRRNPGLVEAAKEILRRRLHTCAPGVRPLFQEWQRILDGEFEDILAVLAADGERAKQLRQASPFAGEKFITREERNSILREFRNAKG